MFAQCDVKKEKTPKKYPAFGETLFSIATENLPAGVTKDKNSVVAFFRTQDRLGFDPSCTYAWLKGDVIGSKPLVAENFKRILREHERIKAAKRPKSGSIARKRWKSMRGVCQKMRSSKGMWM